MSGVLTNSTIASRGVVVKRHPLDEAKKTQSLLGSNTVFRSCRPDVLSKMPLSCNLTFDLLRSMIDQRGQARASVRYLADVSHLSPKTVWRALRRLRGANLISVAAASHGTRATAWQLRWRSPLCSFPQLSVSPAPIRCNPEKEDFNPKGTVSSIDQQPKPSKRALAWAAAQVRNELTEYYISRSRRQYIVTGITASLWRKMKQGEVHAGPELGAVVSDLIAWLRDARGVSEDLRSWCSWAGWAVRGVLEDRRRAETERIASERLIEQIRQEREDAKGGLQRFLSEAGVGSLSAYIQALGLREAHAEVSLVDNVNSRHTVQTWHS